MRDSQDHSLLSQDGQTLKVSRILNADLMIDNISRAPKSIVLFQITNLRYIFRKSKVQ